MQLHARCACWWALNAQAGFSALHAAAGDDLAASVQQMLCAGANKDKADQQVCACVPIIGYLPQGGAH